MYQDRAQQRREAAARSGRRHDLLANVRLAVFVVGILLLWPTLVRKWISPWWLVAPVIVFIVLMFIHENVLRARNRATRAAEFYERGLARLEERWSGIGADGERFLASAPPFARDLDLFGTGSIFQLLCQARTRAGEGTLAGWLVQPAPPEEVRSRQEAVRELRSGIDLREELALAGSDWELGGRSEALNAWCARPPILVSLPLRAGAWALAALGILSLAGWLWLRTGTLPLIAVIVLHAAYRLRLRGPVQKVAMSADDAVQDLRLLADVLLRLEREQFNTPHLRRLRAQLESGGRPPSRQIRRLSRLVDCFEARRNQIFAPISFLLLWDVHFAFAIEAWRASIGSAVPRWQAAMGEIEALSSLAACSFEHPADVFPEMIASGPRLEAEGLGHPLIGDAQCVRNDVRLDGRRSLLIVSGSNMSGKSTLLRMAGVAVVMAQAGSAVRARRLALSPMAVGASLRVVDSLQSNTSHFYAEIQRLRQIVELTAAETPVLFLIDEILQGTNSHDRRIGVEAVLRTLLARGAVGMITTHDLALTSIAESLGPQAENVHFEDEIAGGRMVFDYTLRPGVVTRSNACDLMRAVGLDV